MTLGFIAEPLGLIAEALGLIAETLRAYFRTPRPYLIYALVWAISSMQTFKKTKFSQSI